MISLKRTQQAFFTTANGSAYGVIPATNFFQVYTDPGPSPQVHTCNYLDCGTDKTCQGKRYAKGLCERHYRQLKRGKLGKTRQHQPGTIALSVAVTKEIKKRLDKLAQHYRVSAGDVVRQALKDFLASNEP